MIGFCCQACGKEFSVPDEYAGRKVVCRSCRSANIIPGGDRGKSSVISFLCSVCGGKLRVKAEHAGKQVKCKDCGEVCVVPSADGGVSKSAVTASTDSEPTGGGEERAEKGTGKKVRFACGICDRKIEVKESLCGEMFDCPECGCCVEVPGKEKSSGDEGDGLSLEEAEEKEEESAFEIEAKAGLHYRAKIGGGKRRVEKERSAAAGVAIGIGKIPLCVGVSIVLAFIGACVWTLIASVLTRMGVNFWGINYVNFLSIGVGCLAGLGLVMFTENRSGFLGLIAIVIGLCGIASGKLMLAKFVAMPDWDRRIEKRDFEEPSRDQLHEMTDDTIMVYTAGCLQMASDGKLAADLVWPLVAEHIDANWENNAIMLIFGPNEFWKKIAEQIDRSALEGRRAEAELGQMALMLYFMDFEKADEIRLLRRQYPEIEAKRNSVVKESKAGMHVALGRTLGFGDMLWITIGLWAAFKFGTGWD